MSTTKVKIFEVIHFKTGKLASAKGEASVGPITKASVKTNPQQ